MGWLAVKRIQRQRTKGWRMPEGAIYVGRPSRWGNPFRVGDYAFLDDLRTYPRATTDQLSFESGALAKQAGLHIERITSPWNTVRWFRAWLLTNQIDRPAYGIEPLHGHDLACWCPLDQPCHADVLLELANL
jgi:hypothetical protein